VALAAYDKTDPELADYTMEEFMPVRVSEDLQEGQRPFLEKRKPNWKGR